jgi:hypothetical protein
MIMQVQYKQMLGKKGAIEKKHILDSGQLLETFPSNIPSIPIMRLTSIFKVSTGGHKDQALLEPT